MPKRRNDDVQSKQEEPLNAIMPPVVVSRLLTDQEIMELLHVSRTTLFRLMNHPVHPMPYIKFFSSLRFDVKDVGDWLQEWKCFSISDEHIED